MVKQRPEDKHHSATHLLRLLELDRTVAPLRASISALEALVRALPFVELFSATRFEGFNLRAIFVCSREQRVMSVSCVSVSGGVREWTSRLDDINMCAWFVRERRECKELAVTGDERQTMGIVSKSDNVGRKSAP